MIHLTDEQWKMVDERMRVERIRLRNMAITVGLLLMALVAVMSTQDVYYLR